MILFRFIHLSILCLMLGACAGSAYELPSIKDTELELAKSEIENRKSNQLKVYDRSDKHYEDRLAKITKKLTENAGDLCAQAKYPSCYFQVIYNSDDEANAYASEGYKVTVFRGLLQYLKNDDEMAAAIGHEMGHHLAHHNEEKLQNVQAGAAVSGILMAVLVGAANANNPYYNYNSYQQQQDQRNIENMMIAGAKIGAISYSKEQEREADLLGAYLLSRAGYDLEKAKNLLFVLSQLPGETNKAKASLTDTHPANPQRIVAWEKVIEEISQNTSKLPYLKSYQQ